MADPHHTPRPSCSLALPDGDRFVEATTWANEEGVDLLVEGELGRQRISLTDEEADAVICVLAGVRVR